ncbi:MAG: hypothetical protein AAF824_03020 [Bacteroidota bacterium]
MRIYITIPVKGNPRDILKRFDRQLFEALTPPGVRVELLRFDGSSKGDRIHVRLFLPILGKQDWVSVITEEKLSEHEAYFVDEGEQLPVFLAKWRHKHLIKTYQEGSAIVEDITYEAPNKLLGLLLYPLMYVQFAYRKIVYRKVFGKI